MTAINPKQIILAREARGLTQNDLLRELTKQIPTLNQGNFSKLERGLVTPSPYTIECIASTLKFPLDFFYEDDVRPALSNLYYRKQYKVTGNKLKKLRANIIILTRAIGHLMEDVDMEMKFERMRFDLTTGSWNPKSAALYARQLLGIPHGPIKNLVSTIEDSGVIIYYTDFDIEGFDGVAAFTDSGWPILFINGQRSNDRIRMNIAHEKAHIALHIPFFIEPYRNEEAEAKEYAGEFLMPSYEIRSDLKNLTFRKLGDLKEYWKVSKAALIEKTYSLGLIDQRTYINMRGELSRVGELKQESGYVDLDKPTLLKKIIDLYKTNLGYSNKELASLARLSEDDFTKFFITDDGGIKLKRLVPMI